MNPRWFEVWVDEGLSPPYLLLLLPGDGDAVTVFDPQKNEVAHEASNYEDAKWWLLEDEFSRVDGRMLLDEI